MRVPTLLVCGINDQTVLCVRPYATDFQPEFLPNYEHANFDCGHDFFLEGQCSSMNESMAVMEMVSSFIFPAEDSETESDPTDSPSSFSSAFNQRVTERLLWVPTVSVAFVLHALLGW